MDHKKNQSQSGKNYKGQSSNRMTNQSMSQNTYEGYGSASVPNSRTKYSPNQYSQNTQDRYDSYQQSANKQDLSSKYIDRSSMKSDPLGSYTGKPKNRYDMPVQDADDL